MEFRFLWCGFRHFWKEELLKICSKARSEGLWLDLVKIFNFYRTFFFEEDRHVIPEFLQEMTSFYEFWAKSWKNWHFCFLTKKDKFLWILSQKLKKLTLLFFDKKEKKDKFLWILSQKLKKLTLLFFDKKEKKDKFLWILTKVNSNKFLLILLWILTNSHTNLRVNNLWNLWKTLIQD